MTQTRLRDTEWRRFLRGPDAELLENLYIPALSSAVSYDRCCGYFSSQVLAVAARGFGEFIRTLQARPEDSRPAMRLLVNEQLDPEDMEALLGRKDDTALTRHLLKGLTSPRDALERNRLGMLSYLVARRWLEVRVGFLRRTNGIAHAKFGLVQDASGDVLAFTGSGNETGSALLENYEELELRTSWNDAEFTGYYQERFERMWRDEDEYVTTVSLPEAVRRELLSRFTETDTEVVLDKEAALATMLWNFIGAAPYLPNGEQACDATALVDPWPHQRTVVEDVSRAFPDGKLLCDEVGLGKTIEAILILRRLLAGRGAQRVLLLVPAGLLKQWQDELREKGGLLVPYWDRGYLCWPDGSRQPSEPSPVLAEQKLLLLSREWARLENNRALVLSSPTWDLVLVDEAHAARRRSSVEREYNVGNLLLELLRELQLRRRARGILLLSATPMQTQPWEPWDLLTVLGTGAPWMVEFADIRGYYDTVARLMLGNPVPLQQGMETGRLVSEDGQYPPAPDGTRPARADAVAQKLAFLRDIPIERYGQWLRRGAPLGRKMHRNTRNTLLAYYEQGLLDSRPARRDVSDVLYDYDDAAERETYQAITHYIDRRYDELEKEKAGKGFVMTVYRRRLASSPYALQCSLERRSEKLNQVIQHQHRADWDLADEEQLDVSDLVDMDMDERIDSAVPADAKTAQAELQEIRSLLSRLGSLGNTDTKLSRFMRVLRDCQSDGRAVLVFTEYSDTLQYLIRELQPHYGEMLGCYSGDGGQIWRDGHWAHVSKADITERLTRGKLQVLVCTDAASEGLNLQAAGAVINYDLPWNPSKVEQRIGRADRIGQRYTAVLVRNLFLDNSVDMRVYQLLGERCGLFTKFVGHMQPVLSLAQLALRQKLDGNQLHAWLEKLQQLARQVDADAASVYAYVEATADGASAEIPSPPVSRKDIEDALILLENMTGKVQTRHRAGTAIWRVVGLSRRHIPVSVDRQTLESDASIHPFGLVGDGILDGMVERLPLTGRHPLVLASHVDGPYRCTEARWVHTDGTSEVVSDICQLHNLVERWSGDAPRAGALLQAESEGRNAAVQRVEQMSLNAARVERRALEGQVAAAKLRLLRELSRTLHCLPLSGDAVARFRFQVAQESDSTGVYHRALGRLGGYSVFPPDLLLAGQQFGTTATEKQRLARRANAEIEAALNDPRWRAVNTLQQMH